MGVEAHLLRLSSDRFRTNRKITLKKNTIQLTRLQTPVLACTDRGFIAQKVLRRYAALAVEEATQLVHLDALLMFASCNRKRKRAVSFLLVAAGHLSVIAVQCCCEQTAR